ncbi:MAG: site-specific integrase [Candidatus Competibacteraceae bacterium]|nr:MAG: site-specific integrase [Candidatus Competibacteraceae bacterium]
MSLYKRGNVWWMRFTTPDGRELRETTGTADHRQAQEYHDTRKAECWRQVKLGERPRYTWQQAVVRWLKAQPDSPWRDYAKSTLRYADPLLGHRYLDQIDREILDQLKQQKQATKVTPATVNRMLEVIRVILNTARQDWGWIDTTPSIHMLPEPQRRIRWLTKDEADRLLTELPEHLVAMAQFTLATGLRERNVVELDWKQVDLEQRRAWIHADQAKGKRAIAVPLNAEAIVILREQQGKHPQRVFTFEGRPVTRANNHAWRKALIRAGIENFRWHDLRHTWASWHVQAGTPLPVLKELGGWATLDMVMRYAHLGADHLAEHAERIARPRLIRTNSGTPEKNALPKIAARR